MGDITHTPMEQLQDLEFCVDSNPPWRSAGLSFVQFTNMNSMRNLIMTGISLFLGISIPQFFINGGLVHTHAGWFNAFLNTVFSSPPLVGFAVAVLLDNTVDIEKSANDRGMSWWDKFRTFNGDNRNEEFYTLPFNLNRFFPPTLTGYL